MLKDLDLLEAKILNENDHLSLFRFFNDTTLAHRSNKPKIKLAKRAALIQSPAF